MNTRHKLDGVASPEVIAKAWDDYLQRFGAGAYISARYGSPAYDVTLSSVQPDRAVGVQPRPFRGDLAPAA